jgi:hypothetical protein
MQNLSAQRKSTYAAERVRNYYFKYDDARGESPLISDGGFFTTPSKVSGAAHFFIAF